MYRTIFIVRKVHVVASAVQRVAHALWAVPRTVIIAIDACIKVRHPYYLLHGNDHGVSWEGVVGACHEDADEFTLNFAKFVAESRACAFQS